MIIDSFGSPTIQSDLQTSMPATACPTRRHSDPGAAGERAVDPNGPDEIGWAEETTLDVGRRTRGAEGTIVLLAEPVDETEGVQGLPEFDELINYALDPHASATYLGELVGVTISELTHPEDRAGRDERLARIDAAPYAGTRLARMRHRDGRLPGSRRLSAPSATQAASWSNVNRRSGT